MTMEQVAKQLFDGMEMQYEHEKTFILERLEELRKEHNWTIEQLNEYCWEDSTRAFDYIFG